MKTGIIQIDIRMLGNREPPEEVMKEIAKDISQLMRAAGVNVREVAVNYVTEALFDAE